MEIPVFGKEQYPLNRESGLSYTISDIYKHVPIHTHTHYELFIISDGAAYHIINDSVQSVRKGELFFIRPNDMHSYNFYHSENFCVRNLGFSTQVLRNVSLFLEQEEKMDKLADYYEEEVDMEVQSLMAALEPMIIIVLAIVVGGLLAACMMPMMSMYEALDAM